MPDAEMDALRSAIDAAHDEQRQALDAGRGEEAMTLFQHWSATAGWLASRIRGIERVGEADWPDAMRATPVEECHAEDHCPVCGSTNITLPIGITWTKCRGCEASWNAAARVANTPGQTTGDA